MDSFDGQTKIEKFDWNKLVKNKKREILRLSKIYTDLLNKSNVSIFSDYAEFIDNKTLKVGKDYIQSKRFLIAVGTRPKDLGLCKEKVNVVRRSI